jgi:hypothetical protein
MNIGFGRVIVAVGALAAAASGCGSASVTVTPTQAVAAATLSATPTPRRTAAVSPIAVVRSDVVGEWVRTQSCQEALEAFIAAGLDDQVAEWVAGNWVGEGATAVPGRECAGARPPEEHTHFFTRDARFGSRDARGRQVDSGDFLLIDEDTLSFPSHAREFEHGGEILVDFDVSRSTASFRTLIPRNCQDTCRVAHAWALSAFFGPTPWEQVED